jgi:hypothetical protein
MVTTQTAHIDQDLPDTIIGADEGVSTPLATRSIDKVASISRIVEVRPQAHYFVELNTITDSLEPIELPNKASLLPTTAKNALKRVPNWLYNDLADKFIELAEVNIDIGRQSTPTFADLDTDGDYDLTIGNDEGLLIHFENQGTEYDPVLLENGQYFEYYNYNIADVGYDPSEPCYADIDDDGDLDIFVGTSNGSIYQSLNIGTPTAPEFSTRWDVLDTNYVFIGQSSPAFADLDYDGDFDLTYGADDGKLYYYENTGSPIESNFMSRSYMYLGIDVGDLSKPAFADFDNDGDLDLTIGSVQDGEAQMSYYRNIGNRINPVWFYDAAMFAGITPISLTNPSPEVCDINNDGCIDLCIGSDRGDIRYFENIGSASDPQWLIWSSHQVFPGIAYYDDNEYLESINPLFVDKYAELILENEYKFVDEIAFAIAQTSATVLRRGDVFPELFVENAKLLYLNDKYIDYADIVDHGDFVSRNYYSTVRYNFNTSGVIESRTLPQNIYYWYIVHPKITDEIPTYINPENGAPALPPTGKFWRDYLFNHNDSAYPLDPDIDNNDDGIPDYKYPREEDPPLLRAKLAGIKTLYNGVPYNAPRGYQNDGYNNTRPWGFKDHAIEAVSNWVAKTLPLNQQEVTDEERPIQPGRIAHHHNGNCGELGDLTVAAARTALIPAAGVLLLAEDHVWSEFYESGWHQWDNYWSDGGSVVDNFKNYWYGWGQRGGSGITKWHGDDHTTEITSQYIPEINISHVTTRVLDRNGNPVDGARVMVGSHWLTTGMSEYQVTLPFPSIWNYTDANGECRFKLATQENMATGNKNFSFRVISKVGNAEQEKTELERGVDYTFTFILEGTVPRPFVRAEELTPPGNDTNPNYRFDIEYTVLESTQHPPNPEVGNYHPQNIPEGLHIDSFVCNSTNFEDFSSGYRFDCYNLEQNNESSTFSFEAQYKDNWHFVMANEDSIETTKKVMLKIDLYSYPQIPPEVEIANPRSGSQFILGDTITFNGTATDEDGSIVQLDLRINNSSPIDLMPNYFQTNGYWYFIWNTSSLNAGMYKIKVRCFDNNLNEDNDEIFIEIIDPQIQDIYPPKLEIVSPEDRSDHYIGEQVTIEGNATDNFKVVKIEIRIDNDKTDITSSYNGIKWSYTWDTTDTKAGGIDIAVFAYDEANNLGRADITLNLNEPPVDSEDPEIEIITPTLDMVFDSGELVKIKGEASDDMGVVKLELSLDSKLSWVDITTTYEPSNVTVEAATYEKGNWWYDWNTEGLDIGSYIIFARAYDGVGNEAIDALTLTLRDGNSPDITIEAPTGNTQFKSGQTIKLRGLVYDDVEISELRINIDNVNLQDEFKRGIELDDDEWAYDWQTYEGLPTGRYVITVTATDIGGNQDTDSVTISLTAPKDAKSGFFTPGFEVVGILVAIGICGVSIWRKRSKR